MFRFGCFAAALFLVLSTEGFANEAVSGQVIHNHSQANSKVMSLEDLTALLKDTSALKEEGLAQLSPSVRKQLLSELGRLKRDKGQFIKEENKRSQELKRELRKRRRKIQKERLNTFGPMDEKAKRRLFANLLDQANVDARKEAARLSIEERFAVTVYYRQDGSSRSITNIAAGDLSLWTNIDTRHLAQQDR